MSQNTEDRLKQLESRFNSLEGFLRERLAPATPARSIPLHRSSTPYQTPTTRISLQTPGSPYIPVPTTQTTAMPRPYNDRTLRVITDQSQLNTQIENLAISTETQERIKQSIQEQLKKLDIPLQISDISKHVEEVIGLAVSVAAEEIADKLKEEIYDILEDNTKDETISLPTTTPTSDKTPPPPPNKPSTGGTATIPPSTYKPARISLSKPPPTFQNFDPDASAQGQLISLLSVLLPLFNAQNVVQDIVKPFDGTPSRVRLFGHQLQQYNASTNISDSALSSFMINKLKGTAEKWYENNYNGVAELPHPQALLDHIITEFEGKYDYDEVMRNYRDFSQGEDISFNDYYQEKMLLAKHAGVNPHGKGFYDELLAKMKDSLRTAVINQGEPTDNNVTELLQIAEKEELKAKRIERYKKTTKKATTKNTSTPSKTTPRTQKYTKEEWEKRLLDKTQKPNEGRWIWCNHHAKWGRHKEEKCMLNKTTVRTNASTPTPQPVVQQPGTPMPSYWPHYQSVQYQQPPSNMSMPTGPSPVSTVPSPSAPAQSPLNTQPLPSTQMHVLPPYFSYPMASQFPAPNANSNTVNQTSLDKTFSA
mmetsp:Transcript_30379/g.33932  ORF Transcript_30379/g.33932 Transcript_30379/m.33932 type:complete len:592 (+) Transcript_30379:296-2071(+)